MHRARRPSALREVLDLLVAHFRNFYEIPLRILVEAILARGRLLEFVHEFLLYVLLDVEKGESGQRSGEMENLSEAFLRMSLVATRIATGGEKNRRSDCRSNGYADSTFHAHVTASQGEASAASKL